MPLVVVGALALDTIETPVERASDVLGGAGAYAALAARLYIDVALVGAVGADMPADQLQLLAGVDLDGLQRLPGKSLSWQVEYGDDFQATRIVRNELNTVFAFQPEAIAAPYVYVGNLAPSLQMAVLEQLHEPRFVGLDTNGVWLDEPLLRDVFTRVDAVFLTDDELRAFTGVTAPIEAARQVVRMGPRVVFVKRGSRGALAITDEDVCETGAYATQVRDPTGAGDAFAGAVMGYLAARDDTSWPSIERASRYGSAVASFVVEQVGTHGLLRVRRADLEQRAAEVHQRAIETGKGHYAYLDA